MIKCKCDGCTNHASREGFCRKHFVQNRGAESMAITDKKENRGQPLGCYAEGCASRAFFKGLCTLHYNRSRAGWSLDGKLRLTHNAKECSIKDCLLAPKARGYCQHHYDMHWRRYNQDPCIIDGCNQQQSALKLCSKHYWRLRNNRLLDSD